MNLVPLTIKGISYSQTQAGAYALIMGQEIDEKKLPIIIGGFEAQSIAIALERDIKPPRPLVHDLFKNIADIFDIAISKVVIEKLHDGVFYSSIHIKRDGKEHSIDARTSDAVALAIRFKAPIFTTEEILKKAGIDFDNVAETTIRSGDLGQSTSVKHERRHRSAEPRLGEVSAEELREIMREAIKKENYELAARVRDELERRRTK